MGFFDRFGNGTATTATGESLMDRLSRANGWTADARHGNGIVHHFKGDARTPRRDVVIVHPPGNELAIFGCKCRAKFVARSMAAATLALFLARNNEGSFAKWQIAIEDGEVSAEVRYTALVGGLDAKAFRVICLALLAEVAFVEEALHSQGML